MLWKRFGRRWKSADASNFSSEINRQRSCDESETSRNDEVNVEKDDFLVKVWEKNNTENYGMDEDADNSAEIWLELPKSGRNNDISANESKDKYENFNREEGKFWFRKYKSPKQAGGERLTENDRGSSSKLVHSRDVVDKDYFHFSAPKNMRSTKASSDAIPAPKKGAVSRMLRAAASSSSQGVLALKRLHIPARKRNKQFRNASLAKPYGESSEFQTASNSISMSALVSSSQKCFSPLHSGIPETVSSLPYAHDIGDPYRCLNYPSTAGCYSLQHASSAERLLISSNSSFPNANLSARERKILIQPCSSSALVPNNCNNNFLPSDGLLSNFCHPVSSTDAGLCTPRFPTCSSALSFPEHCSAMIENSNSFLLETSSAASPIERKAASKIQSAHYKNDNSLFSVVYPSPAYKFPEKRSVVSSRPPTISSSCSGLTKKGEGIPRRRLLRNYNKGSSASSRSFTRVVDNLRRNRNHTSTASLSGSLPLWQSKGSQIRGGGESGEDNGGAIRSATPPRQSRSLARYGSFISRPIARVVSKRFRESKKSKNINKKDTSSLPSPFFQNMRNNINIPMNYNNNDYSTNTYNNENPYENGNEYENELMQYFDYPSLPCPPYAVISSPIINLLEKEKDNILYTIYRENDEGDNMSFSKKNNDHRENGEESKMKKKNKKIFVPKENENEKKGEKNKDKENANNNLCFASLSLNYTDDKNAKKYLHSRRENEEREIFVNGKTIKDIVDDDETEKGKKQENKNENSLFCNESGAHRYDKNIFKNKEKEDNNIYSNDVYKDDNYINDEDYDSENSFYSAISSESNLKDELSFGGEIHHSFATLSSFPLSSASHLSKKKKKKEKQKKKKKYI